MLFQIHGVKDFPRSIIIHVPAECSAVHFKITNFIITRSPNFKYRIYLFSFCFSRNLVCFLCHHQHAVVHPDYFHFHRLSNLFRFSRLCQVSICLLQWSWSPRSQSLMQIGEPHSGKANWLHLLWPTITKKNIFFFTNNYTYTKN